MEVEIEGYFFAKLKRAIKLMNISYFRKHKLEEKGNIQKDLKKLP